MLNPFKDVNWNPGRAERRKFARGLMIGFPAIALVFASIGLFKTHSVSPVCYWLGGIGFAIGLFFWLVPQMAKPFYIVWHFIGCSIGILTGNLVMAVFYFGILTPLGWLLRVTGRLTFRKTFDRTSSTYWQDAEKPVDLNRCYRQF
jgi:hypothetical protein